MRLFLLISTIATLQVSGKWVIWSDYWKNYWANMSVRFNSWRLKSIWMKRWRLRRWIVFIYPDEFCQINNNYSSKTLENGSGVINVCFDMRSPDTASSQKLLLSCASRRGETASSVQEATNSAMVSRSPAAQHLASANRCCCFLPAWHEQFIILSKFL